MAVSSTQWGMTPEQVAAGQEEVALEADRGASTADSRILAVADYTYVSEPFIARFGFDRDNRLNRISLEMTQLDRCPAMLNAMREIYGQPHSETQDGDYVAKWGNLGGNDLSLTAIGGVDRHGSAGSNISCRACSGCRHDPDRYRDDIFQAFQDRCRDLGNNLTHGWFVANWEVDANCRPV